MTRFSLILLFLIALIVWCVGFLQLDNNLTIAKILIHGSSILYFFGLLVMLRRNRKQQPVVSFWKKSGASFSLRRFFKIIVTINLVCLTPFFIFTNAIPYNINLRTHDWDNIIQTIEGREQLEQLLGKPVNYEFYFTEWADSTTIRKYHAFGTLDSLNFEVMINTTDSILTFELK